MGNFLFQLLLCFCFVLLAYGSDPIRCTQLSSTYFYNDYGSFFGKVNGSATLSVYKRDNIQYVSISDVNVFKYETNSTANQICYKAGKCTKDLSKPFEMQIGNETLRMGAFFPESKYGVIFFTGLVDDTGFFNFDGSLFTFEKNCYSTIYNQSDAYKSEVHCCSKDEPVPQIPANSPKCSRIQSRSSILNVDDNYSIFSTSVMTFDLEGNYVDVHGTFNGPGNYTVRYDINDQQVCDSSQNSSVVGCYSTPFYFPYGQDGKALIYVDYTVWNGNSGQTYSGMLGRLLFRNGILLMEEGVPFTPTNNCYYQNYPFPGNSNQVVNNQFCCASYFSKIFHPKKQEQNLKVVFNRLPKPHLQSSNVVEFSKFDQTLTKNIMFPN